MLKKTITYEDFDGNQRTEDFYFNISSTELTELEMSIDGGFGSFVQKVTQAQDIPTLANVFRDFILMSYGEKSADGKYFVKKDSDGHRLADRFVDSAAYDALYMELVTDDKKAADFLNSIIPKNIAQQIKTSNDGHPALTTNG